MNRPSIPGSSKYFQVFEDGAEIDRFLQSIGEFSGSLVDEEVLRCICTQPSFRCAPGREIHFFRSRGVLLSNGGHGWALWSSFRGTMA